MNAVGLARFREKNTIEYYHSDTDPLIPIEAINIEDMLEFIPNKAGSRYSTSAKHALTDVVETLGNVSVNILLVQIAYDSSSKPELILYDGVNINSVLYDEEFNNRWLEEVTEQSGGMEDK